MKVLFSAAGQSLFHRSPIERGVSECDRKVSIMRWPLTSCRAIEMKNESPNDIATRYGLYGPGIEFWLGQIFHTPSRPAPSPIHPPVQ
jgi:hypothetical protein